MPAPAPTPVRHGAGRAALFVAAVCLVAGCEDRQQKLIADLQDKNQSLEDQVRKQREQLATAGTTIERLQNQVVTLQAMGGPERLKLVTVPAKIELVELSGGYDDDGKSGDDGVVVHVQPRDADGDVIKAAGAIQVQLFDLANPPAQQLVCEHRWNPDEARKVWYGKLMTNHYTLKCPWPAGGAPQHSGVTIRVVFNDVLTGQRFEEQKLVQVRLPRGGS